MLRLRDIDQDCCRQLLATFDLQLGLLAGDNEIPFSFWGECEAGLGGACVFARWDTPVHSLLHETAHGICAVAEGRSPPWGDAGSDDLEECAVCYLQVLLADDLGEPVTREQMFRDMDTWGYSFREGSAERWFRGDGIDGLNWLRRYGVVDRDDRPRSCP